ncbi:DSD1 family PLP-dependent enzyme [Lentisphaerota bacterium ZTH]|nr:DSD1 family PLP-dependent enzyme [Lentisphaerota bacterium]WET05133.1 DSD1 family PLP-dependent enzyme [Lentisphaerota bacterium ZTH]
MQKRWYGLSKNELDTPCLILDVDLFEENLHYMNKWAAAAGKKLRPHVKTHKCVEIARRQLAGTENAGVCAAKVSEAEVLVNSGIDQVLVTSPVVTPFKIKRLLNCLAKTNDIIVVVDNPENVEELNSAALSSNLCLSVLVDINPDMGRTGADYPAVIPLAEQVHSKPGLRLKGIQCYAGIVQHIEGFEERRRASLKVMLKAAELFRKMRASGLPVEVFSGAGTGTYDIDTEIAEVTDLQVGSYCVMDAEYCNISSRSGDLFTTFHPALTLLAHVISTNQSDFVTVDAGLKAMYFTPHAPPHLLNPAGKGWVFNWFGDEHGRVYSPHIELKPRLGDVIELNLAHCDPTINLYDSIWVARNGRIIDRWQVDLRGCSQ